MSVYVYLFIIYFVDFLKFTRLVDFVLFCYTLLMLTQEGSYHELVSNSTNKFIQNVKSVFLE